MKLKILCDLWSIKQLASLAFCHENAKVLAAVRDAPPLSAPSANSPSPDGGKLAIFSHKNYADIHRSHSKVHAKRVPYDLEPSGLYERKKA